MTITREKAEIIGIDSYKKGVNDVCVILIEFIQGINKDIQNKDMIADLKEIKNDNK